MRPGGSLGHGRAVKCGLVEVEMAGKDFAGKETAQQAQGGRKPKMH